MDHKKTTSELISPDYMALNAELHQEASYGASGWKCADDVTRVFLENGLKTILDYGCGKGTFSDALKKNGSYLIVHEYDPAVPGKAADPPSADLVLCSDVLEHVEPECLDAGLDHISSKAKRAAFFIIATRPALKTLPDGRNAHLTVETGDWWLERLAKNFNMVKVLKNPVLLAAVAAPR